MAAMHSSPPHYRPTSQPTPLLSLAAGQWWFETSTSLASRIWYVYCLLYELYSLANTLKVRFVCADSSVIILYLICSMLSVAY